MTLTLLLILIAVISYALGCLNGSIIVSRRMFGTDIRSMGSGNAGATNFFRSYGKTGLIAVIAVDVLKGVIAALLGGLILSLGAPEEELTAYYREIGRAFATFCCIMGHCFPVSFGFRGGKGILCGVACVFVMEYHAGIICLLVFAVIVGLTHYVSLGSLLAALSVPITLLAQGFGAVSMWLVVASVVLVTVQHRQNIVRLINHKETKIDFRPDVASRLDNDDF